MDKKALIKALRDTVQSASNTVASGVSAPVDLIAAGLRKVGLPIPQAPVGGSQWMENIGLTVPVEDGIPKMAGDFLGMIVPMAATAKAPQIAAAANRGLENLTAPRTLNTPGYGGQRGAIVWHGSPHKFEAFDASKIGTGEGAQAYGHGMYFAESPDVARGYQEALAGPKLDSTELTRQIRYAKAKAAQSVDESARQGYLNAVKELEENQGTQGYFYKVDLPDEAIARMLDWDKPLSQQAPDVQRIINEELKRIGGGANTGERAYKELMFQARMQGNRNTTKAMRNNLEALEASKRLQELGIPGIRYLDAGSRATGGTSNFIVFPGEERLLRILERNNQPMGLMGVK